MVYSKLLTYLLAAFIFCGTPFSIIGQDIAQLAMRARINLYDNWNFDSVAYYVDKVIGKRHAPAFAYSDYGWYLMLVDKYEEGLTYIEKAAKMAPRDKQLITWNAWALLWETDLSKAKQWIDRALAIDPYYGEALYVSSMIATAMKDHNEAIRLAEKAATNDPNWRGSIPLALAKGGNQEQAIAWAEKIAQDENAFDAWLLMEAYAYLKMDDKALDHLQKAYELRFPFMPWLELAPGLEHLHNHPRFKAIVQKMHLP